MTAKSKSGKLIVLTGGWLLCPLCGKGKLAKVKPTTRGTDLIFYCKRCRQETVADIL